MIDVNVFDEKECAQGKSGAWNRPPVCGKLKEESHRNIGALSVTTVLIRDAERGNALIDERKRLGLDHHDEVWEGVYVMPSMPSLEHQKLVRKLTSIIGDILDPEELGEVYPGANVSDRRKNWKSNYRVPDVVAVLKGSRAIECETFIFGGPDFVVEVESPGDESEEKIPFYAKIGVRELLLIDRDRRTVRLLRHDGEELVEIPPRVIEGKPWHASNVLPLAFRRVSKGLPRMKVRRTDGERGSWLL